MKDFIVKIVLLACACCLLAFAVGIFSLLIMVLDVKPEELTFDMVVDITMGLLLFLATCTGIYITRKFNIAQVRQETLKLLVETRMSETFQNIIKKRKAIFPTDQDILLKDWNDAHASGDPAQEEGADALQQLLNYYEFLAVGIAQGDLNEELLKSSVRGIMCNLVDDARFMIAELRVNDPKTFEYLVPLYDKWRSEKLNYAGVTSERPIPSRRELNQMLAARAR